MNEILVLADVKDIISALFNDRTMLIWSFFLCLNLKSYVLGNFLYAN